MTVVIPTGQYANIQPVVEGIGETFELAQADALKKANSFYEAVETAAEFKLLQKVAEETNVTILPLQTDEVMQSYFTGKKLYRNKEAHSYLDEEGNKYLSGSKFASQYEHEFDKASILPRYAKKYDVRESEIEELWNAKALASTTFGTALHQALETYGKYYQLNKKLGKDPLSIVHPTFRPIVAKFFTEERLAADLVFEAFVFDSEKHRCGEMDLVTIVDREKKILDIEDYKTNADLFKMGTPKVLKAPYAGLPNMPASKYALQLNFYKAICEAKENGWTVRSLKLHHWGGDENTDPATMEWKTTVLPSVMIDHTPMDVSKIY